MLGVVEGVEHEVETVAIENDDCLLFYTDGLIDAADFEGELWGREKMLAAAKLFTSYPAQQMISSLLGYRRRFVGLAKQTDDTSLIVVKAQQEKG